MNEDSLNNAAYVPMKVDRVFDSCSDKDCITNLQVVLESGGDLPPQFNAVKTRCVSIDNICMNVEPIPFKAIPHRAGGTDTQSDFSSDCAEMMPLG